MSKTIRVGLMFEFSPDTYHEDMFEGMTFEQVVESCKNLAYEDISRFTYSGELYDSLSVEIIEEETNA